jgi:hypothetical protein
MAKWFLARPYATPFPLSEDELRSRIRQGTLAGESLVWTKGMSEWIAVRSVPALADDLKRAPARSADANARSSSAPTMDAPAASQEAIPTTRPATPLSGTPAPPAPVQAGASAAAPSKPAPPYPSLLADREPDSGGTVVLPDAPKRPPAALPREPQGPSTTRLPPVGAASPPGGYPPAPRAASPTMDTQVGVRKAEADAAGPPAETPRKGPPRLALVGGVLVVVLLLVIVGASAKSRSHPLEESGLYAPCLGQSIARLREGGGLPCDKMKLTVKTQGSSIVVALEGIDATGVAGREPELVASVLPNLPKTPTMSRSLDVRQVMRLDLRGVSDTAQRTRVALKTYVDAEAYLESYELMRGHRFARWLLDDGRFEVENKPTPDGPKVVFQFFPGEGSPGALTDADRGLNTPEVPWAAPWNPPSDPAYLTELRKAMMADGWWYDDAEAFMNAAAVDGIERTSAAAAALGLIAHWLRTSDQWDPRIRHSVWTDCFSPRINGSASIISRERFDQLAGVKDIEPFANPPDYHNADEQITVEGFTFNASIGSATHAYCAIAMGDPLIDVAQETPANKVLRRGQPGARNVAERLIRSPKFLAAIGEELTKARAQLLRPGAPEL